MSIDREIKYRSRRGFLELDLFLSDFIDAESSLMNIDEKKILLEFLTIDDMAMLDILQKKIDPPAIYQAVVLHIENFNANKEKNERQ